MKEEDIRPRTVQDRYLALCAEDAAELLQRTEHFDAVPCPGCGDASSELAFMKQGFQYHTCADCGTLYLKLRPSAEALEELNDHSPSARFWAEEFYPAVIERRREPVYARRARFVAGLQGTFGTRFEHLLDVGAGCGIFAEELAKEMPAADISIVEPGPCFAAQCRDKGFSTHECMLEDLPEDFPPICFCSAFEVLEHLHSPLAFLDSIRCRMRAGGVVFVSSLCCDGFDIQVMWEKHRNVYPPCHVNILSIEGYRRLFEAAGFVNVQITTPGALDVDIVRSQLPEAEWPRFLKRMFSRGDERAVQNFQRFLAENRFSSHCWVTAQLP